MRFMILQASEKCPYLSNDSLTTMITKKWFVLRDLKKSTTKGAAYIELPKLGIRCFTPMHWVMSVRGSVRIRKYVPVVRNLLFVYESRLTLDPIIAMNGKLQYLYARGGAQSTPMTVLDEEMDRFINAVNNDDSPIYFTPEELTADLLGKEIIVKGGPLDGYRGRLLKLQGSKRKRLVVEIKGFMAAAVEIDPDFIQLL